MKVSKPLRSELLLRLKNASSVRSYLVKSLVTVIEWQAEMQVAKKKTSLNILLLFLLNLNNSIDIVVII